MHAGHLCQRHTEFYVQLFQRRYHTAARYKATKEHLWILEKLGVDGMSSDEEDVGAPVVRYRVFVRPWRHSRVTAFLRILDALHRRWRKKAGTGSKRGSPPRLRFLCKDVSRTRAVANLPCNAYDDAWLATLSTVKKDDLRAQEKEYDFTHDGTVTEYVPSPA